MPLHIVCPHCLATNRVLEARLRDGPTCGACRRALFTGEPLEVNEADFDRLLARSDLPLLVDFWAPWCGPCRMMAPAFRQAAARLEPDFRLLKVNTEDEQRLGARYAIRSIPTLALFLKGRERARRSGAMAEAELVCWARDAVGGTTSG